LPTQRIADRKIFMGGPWLRKTPRRTLNIIQRGNLARQGSHCRQEKKGPLLGGYFAKWETAVRGSHNGRSNGQDDTQTEGGGGPLRPKRRPQGRVKDHRVPVWGSRDAKKREGELRNRRRNKGAVEPLLAVGKGKKTEVPKNCVGERKTIKSKTKVRMKWVLQRQRQEKPPKSLGRLWGFGGGDSGTVTGEKNSGEKGSRSLSDRTNQTQEATQRGRTGYTQLQQTGNPKNWALHSFFTTGSRSEKKKQKKEAQMKKKQRRGPRRMFRGSRKRVKRDKQHKKRKEGRVVQINRPRGQRVRAGNKKE